MRKKVISAILCAAMVGTMAVSANEPQKMSGHTVSYEISHSARTYERDSFEYPMISYNGCVYIAVRDFAKVAGKDVVWNGEKQEIAIVSRFVQDYNAIKNKETAISIGKAMIAEYFPDKVNENSVYCAELVASDNAYVYDKWTVSAVFAPDGAADDAYTAANADARVYINAVTGAMWVAEKSMDGEYTLITGQKVSESKVEYTEERLREIAGKNKYTDDFVSENINGYIVDHKIIYKGSWAETLKYPLISYNDHTYISMTDAALLMNKNISWSEQIGALSFESRTQNPEDNLIKNTETAFAIAKAVVAEYFPDRVNENTAYGLSYSEVTSDTVDDKWSLFIVFDSEEKYAGERVIYGGHHGNVESSEEEQTYMFENVDVDLDINPASGTLSLTDRSQKGNPVKILDYALGV